MTPNEAGANSRPAGPFHRRGSSDARRALHRPRRRLWLSLGSLSVNSDCMQKIGILLIIVVPVVLLVWWTGGFGVSRTVRSPFMAELNQVKQISVALSYYAEEHSNDVAGKSIEAFIAAGVLSTNDANYMRDHQITFRGFNTNQNSPAPILEAIYNSRDLQRRIVGYSDGSVQAFNMDTPK